VYEGAKTYPLHPGQARVLKSTRRFTAAIAGTGGGKTALGAVWAYVMTDRTTPTLGLVIAPTYPILARATAPTLVDTFKGTPLEGRYVPSQCRYYLPDGGVIWLLSADNPGGLEGGQFDWCWVDEGGQIKYDAWIAIQGRTGQKEAPVVITTTPYGENWLFHKFYKRWQMGDKDYLVVQWASNANPAYPQREYERALRAMAAHRAAMRYKGEFIKAAGLVYPDLVACRVKPYDAPEGLLVGGIDFGFSNPFAALAGTLYESEAGKDILYVWYERYKRRTVLSTHARRLPKGVRYWADPSRPDSIKELRISDHVVRKGNNSILTGIDAVTARIYSGRLHISAECRALFAESTQYKYPEKDDEVVGDKPLDDFNHSLDALRYLVMGVDGHRMHEIQESISDAA
jgi:phage terminase large subunit